jgi:hypothetical protein
LSLSLKEEHKLRVFQNRLLRRLFGCKREEVVVGCRRLHNGVIMSRRMRWVGNVACIGEKRNAYKILVRKCEGETTWEAWA